MTAEKPVVNLDEALKLKIDEAPVKPAPKAKYRFKKLRAPAQAVRLDGGEVIKFRIPDQNSARLKGQPAYGLFETDDKEVGEQLLAFVKTGRHSIVRI